MQKQFGGCARRLTVGAAALMFVALAQEANATLSYTLRLVGGATSKNSLSVNEVLNIELFAIVTGSDGSNTNDGFQDGYLSVLSGTNNNVRGNLSGTLTTTFAASSSQNGTAQDLDSDGDKDLGSNLNAFNGDFIDARAASMQTTSGTAITGGREFKLANLTFTVTQILNPLDPTPMTLFTRVTNFSSPIEIEAVWQEDGIGSSMTPTPGGTFPNSFPQAGGGITLRAIPEPGSALLLLSGLLAFAGRRTRRP